MLPLKLSKGWGEAPIDHQGRTKTDPKQAVAELVAGTAALAPLGGIGEETGGYKGYGYATVVEILSAALQQGAFMRQLMGVDESGQKVPYRLGHFFLAIDIESFTSLESFKKITGDILRELRASKKAPGAERIWTCGEKEYYISLDREKHGVPVDSTLQKQLVAMRDELGLEQHRFPFE